MDETHAVTLPAALRRPFRAIVFDWDGTAVASRAEDATALARLLEELLGLGVWIVVITGTNFQNIERQLGRLIARERRARLVVCTNRGSEVYGFTEAGRRVRRWARWATPEEDRTLTAIADAVREALRERTGLEVGVVYDRLNRRKIDLIPLPEWADPPKSQFAELLEAVEGRLRGAGLAGGLAEALALTAETARRFGMPEARITSDIKHIEVGLTDKGDSMAWVREHLLKREGIPLEEVLVVGDEFGLLPGVPGSDDRIRAAADGAVVVSVGVEPSGVPAGVLHLGGGPAMFRALLAEQVRCIRERGAAAGRPRSDGEDWVEWALRPPVEAEWQLVEEGFRPTLELAVESRLSFGNGFLGVRGALEVPTSASRPQTFVAGLFDLIEREPRVPRLIVAPEWTQLGLTVDGERVRLEDERGAVLRRVLDFRRGVLLSEWCREDDAGRRLRLRTLRFASLAERSVAAHVARLEVEGGECEVTLDVGLDPQSTPLALVRAEGELTVWETPRARRRLAVASAAELHVDGRPLREVAVQGLRRRWRWQWRAAAGERATLWRAVALAREDEARARAALRRARRLGPRRLLAAHARAWERRWGLSDVVIEGDAQAQRALRFALYHLNAAANPEDERVSIAARGLTGEGYLGHVFWDTEIFLLPFYIFTWPAAARALLMYRYHTLPAARAKAAGYGYRGALFAWESADTGEEVTPAEVTTMEGRVVPILSGVQEHHISADVAYAAWQYWQHTRDVSFLLEAGAELILETARFWASRAVLRADGKYHIHKVVGPDEYHEGVDDNAFTNVMAQWNLERGLEVAELLARRWPERWSELAARLDLRREELEQWRDVAARMTTGQDPETGLFEQFAGFFQLEPIDLAQWAQRPAPMDVILGPERTRRSQVIKQADVVMLLALLWDRFDARVREANFRYYEPRCGHGSSLSPPVHALVAARLGDVALAEHYFRETASIDLEDGGSGAAFGVRIGALGGLWQTVVFGFAGMEASDDGLRFVPHLPASWQRLRFPVQWRGRLLRVDIEGGRASTLTVSLERGRPVKVTVGGRTETIQRGKPVTWRL